jgi:NAD(P)H-nitrite reductase large subunit
MRHVIIGNGIAGTQAAESIRHLDEQCSITMISDEQWPPYSRPMISLVMEGSLTPEEILIRPPDFCQRLNIEPVLGSRVTSLDVRSKNVVIDDSSSGGSKRTIPFDRLLIATGADPRPIKAQGLELENIFFLRNLAQVSRMNQVVRPGQKALVLGGGLVGFKAATAFLKRGLEVTMLITSAHPLSMQLDPPAGELVLNELLAYGLDVRVGKEVTAFEGPGDVRRAHLADDSSLDCDLAVIGKGVLPALDFVPREEISVDLGIRVDEHLETSCPGIFAAGDVAEHVDLARNTPWVNAIWPEAVNQGRVAGMNMAGRPVKCRGSLGRNMIRIFDLDIMTCGLANPPGDGYEVVSHWDPRKSTYRKLIFEQGRLVGAVMVNDIEQSGLLVSLIQSQAPIELPAEKLLSPGLNWKQLISAH